MKQSDRNELWRDGGWAGPLIVMSLIAWAAIIAAVRLIVWLWS